MTLNYIKTLLKSNKRTYRKIREYQFDYVLLIQKDIYYLEVKYGFFEWKRASADFYNEEHLNYYYEKLVEYNEAVKKTITYLK
tara:strand:+ start:294 stop:542 length:249 start_codon:yes stop_codon:yes gene_type:complete